MNILCNMPVRRGVRGCVRSPHRLQRSTFFADQGFDRLELGTLLKDHDDQHC